MCVPRCQCGEYATGAHALQEKAAELLEAYRASVFSSRALLSFHELCELSSDVCPEESTLCMALLQLQRDKLCAVSLHEGEKVRVVGSSKCIWKMENIYIF